MIFSAKQLNFLLILCTFSGFGDLGFGEMEGHQSRTLHLADYSHERIPIFSDPMYCCFTPLNSLPVPCTSSSHFIHWHLAFYLYPAETVQCVTWNLFSSHLTSLPWPMWVRCG